MDFFFKHLLILVFGWARSQLPHVGSCTEAVGSVVEGHRNVGS